MSKILILSDDEIYNQLYSININVYLGCEVTTAKSLSHLKELIPNEREWSIIIVLQTVGDEDAFLAIDDFLTRENFKIPVIAVGSSLQQFRCNVIISPKTYNVQGVLRECAKILNITAKSMAEADVSPYFEVNAQLLSKIKSIPCGIYVRIQNNKDSFDYQLIANKNTKDMTGIIGKFSREKLKSFYVAKLDRLVIVNAISQELGQLLQDVEKKGAEEKVNALDAGFSFVSSLIKNPDTAQEVLKLATSCTKIMEGVAKEVAGLKSLVALLQKNKNGYLYSHAMLSSFVAAHMVRKAEWGGEAQVEKLNFVLFFHDIYLAPIYEKHPHLKYEEDLLFAKELNDEDKELVLNHARLAAEMVSTYKRCPPGADVLIRQHHGMPTGIGFVVEPKEEISPLAKIILIAESFVEEYMRLKDENPSAGFDINEILNALYDRYRKNSYKKLIQSLSNIEF